MFRETIELLAARWRHAAPLMSGFALLARGHPVEIDELAAATRLRRSVLETLLDDVRCERDGAGRLVDLFGMTLQPTVHRLELGGRRSYACCALWAVTIPRLVGVPAEIESTDPVSDGRVRLVASPLGIESTTPSDAAATVAVTDESALRADVGSAFCSNARFFVSPSNAERFAGERERRHVLKITELHALGGDLLAAIFAASGIGARSPEERSGGLRESASSPPPRDST